ncbi:MAG: hypothetical protein CMJ58_27385 [Planctomycetaceae bacterium]|nr:hypothetical protein [Planctomycetaceae bacterium]
MGNGMLHSTSAPRIGRCLLVLVAMTPAIEPLAAAGAEPEAFAVAKWIAPARAADPQRELPLCRKEFQAPEAFDRAALRIVGLGDYKPSLNGVPLTGTGINQPWSQYEKTVYWREIDVTQHVVPGVNCLGVMLTNSFWHNENPPAGRYNKQGPQRTADEPFMLLAEVIFSRGGEVVRRFGTDDTWRSAAGPILFDHVFAGEDFDARKRQRGWDTAGFDVRDWRPMRIASRPPGALRAQHWPPIEVDGHFDPSTIREAAPGVWLYAFPQNCSAQIRVAVSGGKPGDRITLRCGEHKDSDDRLYGHYVVDCHMTADGAAWRHQWNSFYLGMQFVEVTGAVPAGQPNPQGLPVIDSLTLQHVRTALPEVGSFECSNDRYNDAHRLVDWAMRSNMNHVLTDCPHREKLGWLETVYLMAPSLQYRYDCRAWFDKILCDIRDAQEPSGRVLTVAPSYPAGRFPGDFNFTVEWGAAAVLLPWHQYEWSGDRQTLAENFGMMRRFVDFVESIAHEDIAPGGLGDWYDYGHGEPPGPSRFTLPELSATATWAMCTRTVADAAQELGRDDEAQRYRALHARIAKAFEHRFRDQQTQQLTHRGSPQTTHALALCAQLVPRSERDRLVFGIVDDLRQRHWQQTAGDIGHVYLIRALATAGRSDVLHRVYDRGGPGTYAGVAAKGLTSLPETWDARMDGYQSLNHCMLGHVIEWLYGYVGGIRQRPGTVGWRDVVIAPQLGQLSHATTSFVAPTGRIASRWQVVDGEFRLVVEIPPEVEAVAVLPSGRSQRLASGVHQLREQLAADGSMEATPGQR